jgi:hypothetical protein
MIIGRAEPGPDRLDSVVANPQFTAACHFRLVEHDVIFGFSRLDARDKISRVEDSLTLSQSLNP